MNIQGSERAGKTLRTNYAGDTLFINNNDEVLIYLKVKGKKITNVNYINRGRGGQISDFHPMAFFKVLILTEDGYLNLWQYENILQKSNSPPLLLDWHKLTPDRGKRYKTWKKQRFESFAICPKNHWIAVVTSFKRDEFLRRLYWLEVNVNSEIVERARKKLKHRDSERSIMKALSFYGYINDYAIVFGIEWMGRGTRWGFYYDGEGIKEFRTKKDDYHIEEVHKMIRLRNEIWSVDYEGNFVKFKLMV